MISRLLCEKNNESLKHKNQDNDTTYYGFLLLLAKVQAQDGDETELAFVDYLTQKGATLPGQTVTRVSAAMQPIFRHETRTWVPASVIQRRVLAMELTGKDDRANKRWTIVPLLNHENTKR